MDIRPLTPDDIPACLAVFDGNTPRFFAPHERAEFAEFLVEPHGVYLVGVRGGRVLACGGYAVLPHAPAAVLTWGMVARDEHRRGLGWKLLQHRIAALRQHPGLEAIVLETSQHSAPFFARAGFATTAVTPDGFGPGLDKHNMRLELR
jgi:ribosomal protein S18 acetylase RimI-like enzyme